MLTSKLLLIFLFTFWQLQADLTFKSKNSSLSLKGTTAKLNLRKGFSGLSGRLNLGDSSNTRITQSAADKTLVFSDGIVNFGQGDIAFTGTFTPGAGSIVLDAGNEIVATGKMLGKNLTIASGKQGILTGFAVLPGTTTLSSSTSELIVKISNKLNQNISLGSGKVTMSQDLKFADGSGFTGSGTVDLSNNILYLPSGSQTGNLTFLNANDIQFTGDQILNGGTSLFSGAGLTSLVNGNNYTWSITNSGKIQVGANHKLYLNDLRIKGLGLTGSQGYFDIDPTSTIILSNVVLDLAGNYTHGAGTISVEGENCKILPNGYTFTVQNSNCRFRVNEVSFVYDNLSFTDSSPFVFTNVSQHRQLVGQGSIFSQLAGPNTIIISRTSATMPFDLNLSNRVNLSFYNATPGTPKAVTLDGGNQTIKFPNTSGSFLNLDTNVQLTLQNVVLENFNPTAISYDAVSSTVSFGDGVLIKLAKDFSIAPADRAWAFVGNATLDAQNNKLTIDGSSRMTLTGSSKTLTIKNANLQFLSSQPLAVNTASATVALDNSNLTLSSSGHNFSTGNLNVVNEVNLKGSWNIPNGLIFSSAGNLTIKSGASLTLTNTATLQYQANPANDGTNTAATKRHLVMEDATSTLKLVGSTLTSTDTGIALDQGNLIFEGDCTINSSATATSALELSSNVNIQIRDSAAANFYGPVIYG